MMKWLIAGTDRRFEWAAREAQRRGLDAVMLQSEAVDVPSVELDRISDRDAVLMPNPWRTPLGGDLSAEALFERLGSEVRVVMPDTLNKPSDFARPILSLSDSEDYLLCNARLTAEGAVCSAMKYTSFALEGKNVLVIGCGRIGRRLAGLLRGLGCSVSVCARRPEVLREIAESGLRPCPMERLTIDLPRFSVILTTVPDRILDRERLLRIRRGTVLIDLSSAPFSFSMEEAQSLGVQAVRESGLPGRYCPESAGILLPDAALDRVKEGFS